MTSSKSELTTAFCELNRITLAVRDFKSQTYIVFLARMNTSWLLWSNLIFVYRRFLLTSKVRSLLKDTSLDDRQVAQQFELVEQIEGLLAID